MSTRRSRRNKRSQPKQRPVLLSPEARLSAEAGDALRAAYEQFAGEVAHARLVADLEAAVSHRPAVDHLDLSNAMTILNENPALLTYFKTIVEREQANEEVKRYGATASGRRYGFDAESLLTKQPPHVTDMPAAATGARPLSAQRINYSLHDTDSVPNAGFLRQWSEQVEWVRAAINIRREQIGRSTLVCRPVDETKPYNKAIQAQVEALLEDPNEYRDSLRTVVEQAVEDVLVLDRGVIEKSMTPKRVPTALYASDGAMFKIYTGWSGNPDEPRYLYEDSWMNAKVPLRNDEVIMISANPATYRFGLSPVQVLRKAILADIKATESAMQLVEGKPPQHIVQLPKASKPDLTNIRDLYEANIAGKRELLFVGGEEKINLFPLMFSAKDNQWLEWQQYLALKIATIFQISPQQLGLTMNINKATGEVQQELYEDTGLIPLMLLMEEFFNRELLADFAPKDKQGRPNMQALNLQLLYPEISEADRILHAERIINMSKNALGGQMPSATLNQVLEMRGEEPVPGGDAFWVYTTRNGQVPWLSYDPNFDWLAANGLNPDGSRAAVPLAATPGIVDQADQQSLGGVDEQEDKGSGTATDNAKGRNVAAAPAPTTQQLEEKPGAKNPSTPPSEGSAPPAAPTKGLHANFIDSRRSGRRWSPGMQRDYRRQLQKQDAEQRLESELEEKIRKKLLEEFADLFNSARQRKAQAAERLNEPTTREFNPDQSRDDHGRWTSGGGSSAAETTGGSAAVAEAPASTPPGFDATTLGDANLPPHSSDYQEFPYLSSTAEVYSQLTAMHPDLMLNLSENMNVETANDVAFQLNDMLDRYPDAAKSLIGVTDDFHDLLGASTGGADYGNNAFAAVNQSSPGVSVMWLNPKFFGADRTALQDAEISAGAANWSAPGCDSVAGTVAHEFGHVYWNQQQSGNTDAFQSFLDSHSDAEKSAVSGYAKAAFDGTSSLPANGNQESFAEAFASANLSSAKYMPTYARAVSMYLKTGGGK